MPISKNSISSPLEAGTSLLQPMQLPSELLEALDYVSKRLVRKGLHLSLIVVKRDHQLQSPLISKSVTAPGSHSLIASPTTLLYNNAPLTSYTRDISPSSRRSSHLSSRAASPSNTIISNSPSERSTSTAASTLSTSTIYLSRTKYSGLPSSPKDTMAHHLRASISPPSTPCTPTTEWTAQDTPNRYGITLMHSTTLTPRTERILRATISRAEKKFPAIGGNWLSTSSLSEPITDSPTQNLIQRSLSQNRLVFTSAGLSLYSLDYLYTFKCALHVYSRSLSGEDMKIAVDELRRLVLVREGKKVARGELVKCYEWLGISLNALCDVEEGYRKFYGGGLREGAILKEEGRCVVGNLSVRTSFVGGGLRLGRVLRGKVRFGGGGWRERIGRGDRTPNRVEDLSPGTRGEWEFLMKGERRFTLVEVDC
ncbi:210f3a5b-2567-41ca-adef-d5fcd4da2842-CDS [Sclerotinia trifoliorum]|uniref:210f3a5b-2567-41ca-adef-d5fcd4da2842-CDS n=1 Tax=Sclerotinia trifoliorum TaxID=28548 RepID=A0A8H2VVF0_9HELO|nr:210f3a5b-2567-41ca-adef-d5fcd4da2842-CDS [Sclerotinia trifoliorum]